MTSLSDPPCLIEHELYVENAVWILHTLSTWNVHLMSVPVPGGEEGGGTLIFSYILRIGPFIGLKILNFNIFWGGGSEK